MNGLFNKPKLNRQLIHLSPDEISPNPSQPRMNFGTDELCGLAESIRKNGIIQPLAVRRLPDGGYELISGERRLRAAKMLFMEAIPCVLLDVDDRRSAVLALLENLQRQDLSFFEEADGIHRLICEWGLTQLETAERLGKAQSTIANKLRLLKLTARQRKSIERTRLTERHARALLRIPDDGQRDDVLDRIIIKEYNVAETERYIEKLLYGKKGKKQSKPKGAVRDMRLFTNSINKAVDTMRKLGVDAKSEQNETPKHIKYIITIPKRK